MQRKHRIITWLIIAFLMLGGGANAHSVAQGPTVRQRYFPFLVHQRPRPRLTPFPQSVPYVVKEGDTLFTISRQFHRPLHQIACIVPPERPATAPLIPGETLYIPPEASICHVLAWDQTLSRVAAAYGVTLADIVALPQNHLDTPPYFRAPGRRVLLPVPPNIPARPWSFGDGHFIWPVQGIISQGFSPKHKAVDIAADEGTLVAAADTGVVAWAGWNTQGYGWLVIIDHQNGYRTYYAHLESVWVATGERVIKGQPIGVVGSTGHSTGPHLHFEIRDYGARVDPVRLLPALSLPGP